VAPTVARLAGVRGGAAVALALAAGALVAARSLLDPDVPYPAVAALGVAAAGGAMATVLLRMQRHGATTAPGPDGLRAYSLAVWTATPLGAAVGGLVARATEPADVALLAAGASVAAAVAAVAVRSRPAATERPHRRPGRPSRKCLDGSGPPWSDAPDRTTR
jgi:hypothetical protein